MVLQDRDEISLDLRFFATYGPARDCIPPRDFWLRSATPGAAALPSRLDRIPSRPV